MVEKTTTVGEVRRLLYPEPRFIDHPNGTRSEVKVTFCWMTHFLQDERTFLSYGMKDREIFYASRKTVSSASAGTVRAAAAAVATVATAVSLSESDTDTDDDDNYERLRFSFDA